jgi:tetratricopeptide (TPR) repeat protein
MLRPAIGPFSSIRSLVSVSLLLPTGAVLLSLSMASTLGCSRDPNVRKQKYLESGERYEEEGKLREAVIQFSNALRYDQGYAAAHYELAKTYGRMKLPNQEYLELMRTVALSPKNLQARLNLGNLLLQGRQPDRAADQAKAILQQQPNNADAYALLSKVDAVQGRRAEAVTEVQHALTLQPNRSSFNTQLGLLESGDPADADAAQTHLEIAIAQDNADVPAHLALASMLQRKGDVKGALAQLRAAVAAAPKNLQARAVLAGFYLQTGDQAQAEATIRKATEDFADDTEGASMLARYYERTGQASKADAAYADLASKYPQSLPIRLAYARVLLTNGEYDKASDVAKQLTKMDPSNPDVAVLNATLLLHQGKTDDAIGLLQIAAKNYPENLPVKTLLAVAANQKGDYAAAETNFSQAAQLDPRDLTAERGLAVLAERKNDTAQLRQIASTTMKYYPNLPDPLLWRGTAEADDKQYDQAATDFQAALKLDPKDAQAMAELGEIRIQQQHVPEGKALLEQALQVDPGSRALELLLRLDLQDKQPAAAIALIQQQLSKTAPTPKLYDDLATVQLMTKDISGALDSSKKSLRLDPGDALAMRNFTQASIMSGQIGPPMDVWQKWMASHPRDPQGPAFMGMLYDSAGDPTKAMDYYKRSLQLKPDQPVVENNLAFLMVDNGQNSDVALSLAEQAHQQMPESPNTSDTLAWVYYKKGLYPSALELLQGAAKADPNNASVEYHLGMTYSQMNEKAEALTHLKKALQLSPDSPAGKKAAEQLSHLS